jgi:hypothetical protein
LLFVVGAEAKNNPLSPNLKKVATRWVYSFSLLCGRLVVHVAREAAHGESSRARAPGEARRRHDRSSAVAVWRGILEKRDGVCGGREAHLDGRGDPAKRNM